MSRTYLALTLLVCVLFLVPASQTAHAINTFTQATVLNATANVTGIQISAKGWTTATFHVCCTFNAVVKFLASGDSTNADALACVSIGAPANGYAAQVTARGIYRCNIIGINGWIRADVTNYSSGSVTITVGLASAGVT